MQDQPSSKTKTRQDVLLPRNTRRSVPIALLRAREAVMSHFRPMLAQHDITEQQWRVIRILAETDIVDASEMAERAFILAPSLTRIIARLRNAASSPRRGMKMTDAACCCRSPRLALRSSRKWPRKAALSIR